MLHDGCYAALFPPVCSVVYHDGYCLVVRLRSGKGHTGNPRKAGEDEDGLQVDDLDKRALLVGELLGQQAKALECLLGTLGRGHVLFRKFGR